MSEAEDLRQTASKIRRQSAEAADRASQDKLHAVADHLERLAREADMNLARRLGLVA